MSINVELKLKELFIYVDDLFFNVNVARHFKRQFMESLILDLDEITLDLSKVNILDSIAVGTLVHAQTVCAQEGIKFNIVNVHPEIMELIRQVKLDKILNIYQSVDNFDNAR